MGIIPAGDGNDPGAGTANLQASNLKEGLIVTQGWMDCRVGSFQLEVDWSVEPGEVLALFGPSGAGKTTTLRAIAGLLRPRRGHIEIAGRSVYDDAMRLWDTSPQAPYRLPDPAIPPFPSPYRGPEYRIRS